MTTFNGPAAGPAAMIVAKKYRHIRADDDFSDTLCGLAEDRALNDQVVRMACDCGHPECQNPPNCPACLQVFNEEFH